MKFIKADGNNRIITMDGGNQTTTMDGINHKIITMAGDSQILTMVGEITADLYHKTTVVGDTDMETEMFKVKETIMVGATTMVGDFLQSSIDSSFEYLKKFYQLN